MRYAVDKIIDNIVLLENIETQEKFEIDISLLPPNIHDGNIILFENNEYKLDTKYEIERRKLIEEKLNKIKG